MSVHAMLSTAPPLDTPRLSLRAHGLADYEDCAAMWGDPAVTRHIGGRPFARDEVWARLLRYAGHWTLLGFGYWAVRERATGRFVGEVGLADFRRDMEPSFDGTPEAGWVLATWAHNKGFATEAVRATLVWGEEVLRTARTVCMIDAVNAASIRVAEKCGFKEWQRTNYKGTPAILYER
jgi:RimJ/RimL family protein N-acetyltransferase